MRPEEIRRLREHLALTQEVFARILGVSFATVNRWENGKSEPSGDYARVLQTLGQLTAKETAGPPIDWKRVGALSAMAAVAGFSPLLTLGAALAPVLIAHLPSWTDVPLGGAVAGSLPVMLPARSPAGTAPRRQMPAAPVIRTSQARTTGASRPRAKVHAR